MGFIWKRACFSRLINRGKAREEVTRGGRRRSGVDKMGYTWKRQKCQICLDDVGILVF